MVETVGKLMNPTHITSSTTKRDALLEKFRSKITVNLALDRALVSFQANKSTPFYSWFKYKEGFSESLVTYLLQYLQRQPGILLDPFSGASSSLFAASNLGWQAKGIEVLPVGIYASKARFIAPQVDIQELRSAIDAMKQVNFLDYYMPASAYELQHIVITNGAFPEAEQQQLVGYIAYCHAH